MRLTKKKALELTIELWEWLAKTGKDKTLWDGWNKYRAENYCFLCEYCSQQGVDDCSLCPIEKHYGHCYSTCFNDWENADTEQDRKKYAKLFLEQLRAIETVSKK